MSLATSTLQPSSAMLIGEAVHRSPATSVTGLLERTFAFAFRSLVYPQIWEDPRADMEALELDGGSRIVTIASGGCNTMSYLTANPARIYAVDLNEAHIALLKLKLAAARHLPSHTAFFRFFGEADDRRNISVYRDLVAPHLDARTRAYWEGREATGRRRISRFRRNFYRFGLLGRFIGTGHLLARLTGAKPELLLSARSIEEQRAVFDRHIAPAFEHRLVKWLTSRRASLFGLGIPPAQYDALCDNGARAMSDVLRERTERLATAFGMQDNYFARQAFGRRYAPTDAACPPYLERRNFLAIKTRVNSVSVVHANLVHFLAAEPTESLDRYVLLDAQDWMDDATLNALWREITRTARPGARVIFRTAGERTILPGRIDPSVLGKWRYEHERSREIHARDRSAIYGGFHLYVRQD